MSYENYDSYYDYEEPTVIEPQVAGHQLIGDSQFVRFAEQLLGKKRKYRNGLAHIGLCVSGQKINDVLNRLRDNFHPTASRAVVMIGTNDLLRNTLLKDMCRTLKALIDELLSRQVWKIIVLTIPPVPRLAKSNNHWDRLIGYNNFIKQLDNGYDILSLDVGALFMMPKQTRKSSPFRSVVNFSNDDSDEYQGNFQKSDRFSSILSSSPYFRSKSIESSPNGESSNNLPRGQKNLRISIDRNSFDKHLSNDTTVGTKRKVYELEEEDESDDHNSSYESTSSVEFRTPNYKRKSSTNTNLAYDDHNDSFGDDEGSEVSANWIIRNDCFEEFFAGNNRRQDLIHLNRAGLIMIKNSMLEKMDAD